MNKSDKYREAEPNQVPSGAITEERIASIEKTLLEMSHLFSESLKGVFDFEEQLIDPPKAVSDFILRFSKQEEEAADRYSLNNADRRSRARVACSRSVIAVPVSRQLVRIGEPFMAAIQDVSEHGIRLLNTRASNAQYLALRWQADTFPASHISVVIEILRCKATNTFYSISGNFVFAD